MKSITIRETVIGQGRPKICVPLTENSQERILQKAGEAVQRRPDLIEWRADFYRELGSIERVKETAEKLRDILGQIPLIFTVRTKNEGGNCQISTLDYVNILQSAAEIRELDLIDVEFYQKPGEMKELIAMLQARGKAVIASNHHFHETPSLPQMEQILEEMERAGADIRKLAVMPKSPMDVVKLLEATVTAGIRGEKPVVTMSMGSLGAVSRVSGQVFGSCITFGTAGAASAPGQLPVEDLRSFLEKICG